MQAQRILALPRFSAKIQSRTFWLTLVFLLLVWFITIRSFFAGGGLDYSAVAVPWYGVFLIGALNGVLTTTSAGIPSRRSRLGQAFILSLLVSVPVFGIAIPWLGSNQAIPAGVASGVIGQDPATAVTLVGNWVASLNNGLYYGSADVYGSIIAIVALWLECWIGQKMGALIGSGNPARAILAIAAFLGGILMGALFQTVVNSAGTNLVRLGFQTLIILIPLGVIFGIFGETALGAGGQILNLATVATLFNLYRSAPSLNFLGWSGSVSTSIGLLGLGTIVFLIIIGGVNLLSSGISGSLTRFLYARHVLKEAGWLLGALAVCPNCGSTLKTKSRYCKICGAEIEWTTKKFRIPQKVEFVPSQV